VESATTHSSYKYRTNSIMLPSVSLLVYGKLMKAMLVRTPAASLTTNIDAAAAAAAASSQCAAVTESAIEMTD